MTLCVRPRALLEITADEFPERMKALQTNVLFLLNSKEAQPDVFGHIDPDYREVYGRNDFLLTAEVKPSAPTIHDIFQDIEVRRTVFCSSRPPRVDRIS